MSRNNQATIDPSSRRQTIPIVISVLFFQWTGADCTLVILISAARAVFSSARTPIAQFLKTPLRGRVSIYTP